MRTSLLRQRLQAGEPTHCFKVNVMHPLMIDLAGELGMDCLWLCLEHGMVSLETIFGLILACEASDMDCIVRVPNGELSMASRVLDAGAGGIMYPRARSLEEVQELAQWLRHPPAGIRGVDGGTRNGGYTAAGMDGYLKKSAEAVLIVQIETTEALEQVEEMAAVPGIDLLFLGPADLSQSLGEALKPGHPVLDDAVARVAAAAAAHDLAWGMPAFTPEHARELLAQGATFVSHMSDLSLLRPAMQAVRKQLQAVGFRYRR